VSVAVVTSVSSNVAELASITVPNKLEYCLRHGYSLVIDNQPYDQACENMGGVIHYLRRFDTVWLLDCDAVITNMTRPIHSLEALGPHVTVCEEKIVDWNPINCGSVVCRSTPNTIFMFEQVAATHTAWRDFACGWQTWLGVWMNLYPGIVTVADKRAFNSCVWNRPANARDEIGGYWEHGDLVCHPCGVFPAEERIRRVQRALQEVVR
jgi:hypothetical protein